MKLKGYLELYHEQGMEDTSLWAFVSTEPEHMHTKEDLVDGKCPWPWSLQWCPVNHGSTEHATYEGLFMLKDGDRISFTEDSAGFVIKLIENDHSKPPFEGPTYLIDKVPYSFWNGLVDQKTTVYFSRNIGGDYQI